VPIRSIVYFTGTSSAPRKIGSPDDCPSTSAFVSSSATEQSFDS
jgi:hypothetical protein